MKKGGFLRNVLDTIRSNQATGPSGRGGHGGQNERAIEFGGQLKRSHFSLCQVARHGFPENPTSLAFDPVQKIAAIGTKSGAIRIFGRPGVDVWGQHEPAVTVTHIRFIINQGALITVTADDSIHLWSLKGPNLRLLLSSGAQGASGASPQANSPAPTPASNLSSVSPQSASSAAASGATGLTSTATSSSSFLGHLTDTVTGAVDSANEFLTGGTSEYQTTPSPVSDGRQATSRQPELINTLRFQREHITYIHQTLSSKWLYIGTERGNVHVANVETFELSGYSIAWNKAIELSRKTHPGAIIHISDCPQDTNKLLIGYESGCIVIWDLKQRNAEGRYYHTENLLWLAWHFEGKQFVAAHGDGSLITWQTRSNARPAQLLHPHAKTTSAPSTGAQESSGLLQQQQSHASSFARSLNNELYRPINKVEWKVTKSNNEPFYLFSGGLPYDGIDQSSLGATISPDTQRPCTGSGPQSAGLSSPQQHVKTPSASPGLPTMSSLNSSLHQESSSMSKLPGSNDQRHSKAFHSQRERSSLRSTALTVMYGKSLTVLEMDDTIIDFLTICDNSPYENDTSDPYAVIVLLSNELILIDLTSSGYPSFDSPYPSASLNESPVTSIQYLADCSSDLIPFLYSTSQNVISRAPKKGFSDKEWPINGGEWGQSMQSYPELVITGHADGTLKFWDMSSVNFDLISKIKVQKLFEKPIKPPNSILLPVNASNNISAFSRRSPRPNSPARAPSSDVEQCTSASFGDNHDSSNQVCDQDLFAIERIEFCPTSKRLLVACACSQIIQFRLNKKDPHSGVVPATADITSIVVDPASPSLNKPLNELDQNLIKKHHLFKLRSTHGPGPGSSSSGSTSSSGSHRARAINGFQVELVCLTPSLVGPKQSSADSLSSARTLYCQLPPHVTAITFQSAHGILAYAHEFGIVLIDIIQKCVIINATLNDLNGGCLKSSNNQDISIKPYATSSILQHHYQSSASMASTSPYISGNEYGSRGGPNNRLSDNGGCVPGKIAPGATDLPDNRNSNSLVKTDSSSKGSVGSPDAGQLVSSASKQPVQSRYTNTMFQRQLSTNALNTSASAVPNASSTSNVSGSGRHGARLFQRQMTASQLFSSHSSHQPPGFMAQEGGSSQVKRLLASSRADPTLASSAACLTTATNQAIAAAAAASGTRTRANDFGGPPEQTPAKKTTKNKRILSRMLSISAIHTTVGTGGVGSSGHAGGGSSTEVGGSQVHSNNGAGLSGGYLSDDTTDATAATATASIGGSSDKFDSSFRRSRSSSTSSTTGHYQQAQNEPGSHQQQPASESILCIAFLDPAQVGHCGPNSAGAASATGSSVTNITSSAPQSGAPVPSSQASAGAAAVAGQVQSSAGTAADPNHKSLSSIDNNQQTGGSQLALWLGTSSGNVLLVALQMPDNEDNRILQLQSISAEPIPQATIQLSGQILCLAPFTCEGRLQALCGGPAPSSGLTGGSGSSQLSGSSGIQSASQSSSLEGDTMLQSPGSSGSSASAVTNLAGGGSAAAISSAGLGSASAGPSSGFGSAAAARSAGLDSPGNVSFDSRSSLFIAVVSEKQARVYQVPPGLVASGGGPPSKSTAGDHHHHSHGHQHGGAGLTHAPSLQDSPLASLLTSKRNLVAECELSGSSFACRSSVVQMRSPDESCLISYLATGNLVVHPLPRLKPVLMDADFVPLSSSRISQSMHMSRQGHCLYQPSASEICKFTVSAHYKALVNEMMGLVHVPREMPEMPRTNFFKSLFSVSQSTRQSDRDELFGECSAGKAPRSVAKQIGAGAGAGGSSGGGSTGMDKLKQAAVGTMGHDMRVAREGLDERGEKLSDLEDRTLNMMNQAEGYAQAAHQLAQKFKDKKWYQF